VRRGALIRIESPGKSGDANQTLLALGKDEADDEKEYSRVDPTRNFAKGLITAPRQWFLGFRALMCRITVQLAECPSHHLMNQPNDMVSMFDKRDCHARLQAAGVLVPPALPDCYSFEQLEAAMSSAGVRRVFVKLAHGSSASGVVAYQTNGREHRATAAIEMTNTDGETQLFNSRRVETFSNHAEITRLIDTLCRHRVHIEHWIPKASMDGQAFDLRVVAIGGEAAHTVARLSHSPMTNLHLLNDRRDRAAIIAHIGADNFNSAMCLCKSAMQCYPRSLYAGIDLMFAPGFQKHYILEMNAFGDLLHNTFYEGIDTYSLELQRMGYHA
jgi:hypothetical protein